MSGIQPITGDIIAVANGRWTLAKLIQRVTDTTFHHTGIIVEIAGKLYVSEMEAEGHILTPWSSEKYNWGVPKDRTLVLMRLKDGFPDPFGLVDFTLTDTTRYDFGALVQHVILRYFRVWLGRKGAKAARRLTCSERVAYVYNKFTGGAMWVKWWKKSPRDIVEMHADQFYFYTFGK
jgi:hypothetical protein